MSTYNAPLADMRFALNELAGLEEILGLPDFAEVDADTVDAILEEAADRKSTRLNSSHMAISRMPSSA
jgi:hypothetical protein